MGAREGAPREVRVTSLPDDPHASAARTVELPMTAHERRRVRRRIRAADGTELLLELPTGTVLPVGHALHVDGDTAWVVTAAPEEVLVIRPRDRGEAAFVGHLIGNLHRDVDIRGDEVLALWDETLERRLVDHGLEVAREERAFRGRAPGEHSH